MQTSFTRLLVGTLLLLVSMLQSSCLHACCLPTDTRIDGAPEFCDEILCCSADSCHEQHSDSPCSCEESPITFPVGLESEATDFELSLSGASIYEVFQSVEVSSADRRETHSGVVNRPVRILFCSLLC